MTTATVRCVVTRALLAAVILLTGAGRAFAQASSAVTSAVGRARAMVDGGSGPAARTLLDSLVAHTAPGSDDVAEALYWRAALSERAADAERDWKRLVMDVPLSPRAPDALMRLGELELMRGHADAARACTSSASCATFNDTPQRPKAQMWIARSYFEEQNLPQACEVVTALRAGDVPDGELRLQAEEMHNRCLTAGTTPAAGPSKPASTAPPGRCAGGGRQARAYSLQIAAYDTRSQANALVQRLGKRGIKARMDGERKPYRVRVGRYDTKSEAAAAQAAAEEAGTERISRRGAAEMSGAATRR